MSPLRQIVENTGAESSMVVGKLLEASDPNQGFDAETETYVDMIRSGIIDPAKVVRTALQGASSVAGLLITTEARSEEHTSEIQSLMRKAYAVHCFEKQNDQ